MRRITTTLACSLLALLLTACAGTSEQEPGDEPSETTTEKGDDREQISDEEVSAAEGGDDATARGAGGEGGVEGRDLTRDAIEDDSGPLSKRVVYFAFDSSEIQTEYAKLLAAHGEYLGANPDVTVTVEGHTDERGSREYNLALGERRAQSVKQVLTLNGASSDQVETVSYGEERPAVDGNGEEAWSKNRRAKLVYSR